jgi:hypothetical protein
MMNLLWLPCATTILAFDAPCNNNNTTQQQVKRNLATQLDEGARQRNHEMQRYLDIVERNMQL